MYETRAAEFYQYSVLVVNYSPSYERRQYHYLQYTRNFLKDVEAMVEREGCAGFPLKLFTPAKG